MLWTVLLLGVGTAWAQTVTVQPGVILRNNTNASGDFYVVFPNTNELTRYRDRELYYDILDAEDARDTNRVDRLLSLYVRNFAPGNFRNPQDLQLVWKLGQLKMNRRDTAKAIYYFGLALKNQSPIDRKIKQYYDTLRAPKTNDWVDLDYYYDIVAKRRKIDTLIPPKGVLLNMGRQINSPAPDYGPYMHPSGTVLLFTSRRNNWDPVSPDFAQNEDIYYAQTSLFGEGWEFAQRFTDAINTPFNEGSACLNTNATEIYFTRCNSPDGLGICDLYMAEWDGQQFVNARNLGPEVNSTSWDSHPNISPDGNTLFFASNRTGGFGRTDLYMSRRRKDGTWSAAQNLGPVVNTIEDEVTPFLHPVNNTLYFSSKGHLNNFGGFDIVKSRWMGNHWQEPRNLGPLVNTKGDEYYFSLDGRGEKLYYAMARPDTPKDLDLYSFPMPMEARPDAITKLSGYLIDSVSGNPITGIIAAIDQDKGTEIAPLKISPTGYFEFQLVAGRIYTLLVLGDNALNIASSVKLNADTLTQVFGKALDLSKPVVFRAINFKRNSSDIEKEALSAIEEIAEFLHDNPYLRLTIRGHTDSDGEPENNRKLSEKRAQNIRTLLLEMSGAPDTTVIAEGYGDTRPIKPNDNDENKAANRRVEFELFVPTKFRGKLTDVPLTVKEGATELPPARPAPSKPAAATTEPRPVAVGPAGGSTSPEGAASEPGTLPEPPLKPPAKPGAGLMVPPAGTATASTSTTAPAKPKPAPADELDFADDDLLDDLEDDLGTDVPDDPEVDFMSDLDSEDLTGMLSDMLDEEDAAAPDAKAPPVEEVDFGKTDDDDDGLDDDGGR